MVSLFQQFEFIYPDGDLFYDRSGALSRKLREIFPDLTSKKLDLNQREFSVPSQNLELFYGVAYCQLRSLGLSNKEFGQIAAQFLGSVSEVFEIGVLNEFVFQHVVGRPCSTFAQAQELIWPVVGGEQKAKMESLFPSPTWRSIQGEFNSGPFAIQSRIDVLNLHPNPSIKIGEGIVEKMRKIVFPTVQFSGATLEETLEFIRIKSRDYDLDDHQGVEIELDSNLAPSSAHLTLDLREVPMMEVLQYIVELAGLKFKIAPDRIIVVDLADDGSLPHVAFDLQITGQNPIRIAEFDVVAFIQNFQEKHFEILSKLAPHLAEL